MLYLPPNHPKLKISIVKRINIKNNVMYIEFVGYTTLIKVKPFFSIFEHIRSYSI